MAREQILRRLWSVYSRFYDGLLDLVPYQELLDDAVRELDAGAGDTVVDLGCGTGNVAAAVLRAQPTVELVAVDSSADMLEVARRKLHSHPGARVELADVNEWLSRSPSSSADRVVSVNVLYTFDEDSRTTFWSEALRVLAPGGRLVVVTSDRAGIGPVVREHYRRRGSVRRALTPRLAAVGLLNLVIWLFESEGVFDPVPVETLRQECERAGGAVVSSWRCYGGADDGVDVTMVVEPAIDLHEAADRPIDLTGADRPQTGSGSHPTTTAAAPDPPSAGSSTR